MAVTEKQTLSFYSSPGNVPPAVRTVQIAASQGIWMPGAIAYVSNSGLAKVAVASASATEAYHCLLLDKITAELDVNTEVRAMFLDTSHVYQVYIANNVTDAAEAQGLVGDHYGLMVSKDTAGEIGYCTLDTSETGYISVQVIDMMNNVDPEKYDTSTTPGVALVKFRSVCLEATKA